MGIGDEQWILAESSSMYDGMKLWPMMTLCVWAQMNSRSYCGAIESTTGYKAMADDRRRPLERRSARDREDSWRVVGNKGEGKGKGKIVMCPDWIKGKGGSRGRCIVKEFWMEGYTRFPVSESLARTRPLGWPGSDEDGLENVLAHFHAMDGSHIASRIFMERDDMWQVQAWLFKYTYPYHEAGHHYWRPVWDAGRVGPFPNRTASSSSSGRDESAYKEYEDLNRAQGPTWTEYRQVFMTSVKDVCDWM